MVSQPRRSRPKLSPPRKHHTSNSFWDKACESTDGQTPFSFVPFQWTCKKAHPEALYAQAEMPASCPVTVAYRDEDPLNDD